MPPGPSELILPSSLARAQAVALLEERFALSVEPGRVSDRVLLDSFDGRLRAAGLRAERAAGRDGEVVLREPGAPDRHARAARAKRYLAGELPPGPVRERLAPVLEERALLPRVRVRSTVQPLAVLDGERKAVARLELEYPALVAEGGRRVPLAARVSLRPVLGYERAYERALAVLRDDLGLAPAERTLPDEAVLAAGGRPGGVPTKLRPDLAPGTRTDAAASIVLEQLAAVAAANLPGAIDDLDPEFLHDLRVSVRRARSVLRELQGVHDAAARAHVRDELKWAQALTGPVRDLDVQLLEWPELAARIGAERSAELEPLRALLARRREHERETLRRGLRGKRFAAALTAWRALAAEPAAADHNAERPRAAMPIERTAGARIDAVRRRILRDGGRIGDDSQAEALHDLRKRGKELRYLLELFGAVFPAKAVDPLLSELKDLQRVLGRFQDRAVQVETLRDMRHDLAAEPEGPAALIALGPVLDALLADQAAARAEFAERFAAFERAARRKRARKAFGKGGR